MEHMDRYIQQAMAFAKTSQGQQLLRLLQEKGVPELRQAAQDPEQAKAALEKLMQDPDMKALLEALGR